MTLLGAFFIPCAIVCLLWRPQYLLPLLIISSVFEASSLWNGVTGDNEFGILPFYFVQLCVLVRFVMLLFGKEKLLPPPKSTSRRIVWLLLAFWLWSFSSAFIMPRLFAGTLVMSPRLGMVRAPAPLEPTSSNLAQATYLTLNVCMILYALATVKTYPQMERLLKGFFWAVFIVVSIGLTQFLFTAVGGSFPYDVINNNPGYSQGYEQDVGDIHRYNSTFVEPSTAGSFLSAVVGGLFASFLSGNRKRGTFLAILIVLFVLLLTTSTTGLAGVAMIACVLLVYFNPFANRTRVGRSVAGSWLYVCLALGLIGSCLLLFPKFYDAIMEMTVEKFDSFSFLARLASDLYSLIVLADTKGVGAGLGSNRSSGLLATLLSTVGVIGIILLGTIAYRIIKAFPWKSATSSLQLTFWALVTLVVGSAFAVPDINRPTLWVLLMLVITHLQPQTRPPIQRAMSRVQQLVPRDQLGLNPISPLQR